MKLLRDTVITEEEALRNCTNANEFMLHLKGINSSSDRTWAPVETGVQSGTTRSPGMQTAPPKGSPPPPRPSAVTGGLPPARIAGLPDWMSKE